MDTGADTAPSALTSTADLVGRRAVRAVFVAFLASGFAFASWASRIPQVRDALGLEPGRPGPGPPRPGRRVGRRPPRRGHGRHPPRSGSHHPADVPAAGGRPRDRRRRPPPRCPARRRGAVPRRVRQRHLGRGHERRGRRRRAAPGPLDHVPVPRRLQPRHGRRRAAGLGPGRPARGRDRPPHRRRGGRRGRGADLRARVPAGRCRRSTTPTPGRRATRCGPGPSRGRC